jgi:hypothetical protein
MNQLAGSIAFRLAKTTYVVVLKVDGHYTLMMDPGLSRPWRGQGVFGQKFGNDLADRAEKKGYSAKCMTWEDAYSLLLKEYGGESMLEKALMDKMHKKQLSAGKTPQQISLSDHEKNSQKPSDF